jgi:ubiquinone biosynthesis protein
MTVAWTTLLDADLLAAVLPPEQAYLAKPICDALVVFLQGHPPAIQAVMLKHQLELRESASVSERLVRLARDCPVLQKLGQVLARDRRLALELRLQLQQLESYPCTLPWEIIESSLVRELGPLESRSIRLRPPATAEASVAVVVPFEFMDHPRESDGKPREGVFKLLKPGIQERLEFELAMLDRVGEYLDRSCLELGIPHLDYQETFEQVREKLLEEVHLRNEQRHLVEARDFFRDQVGVQIPSLFEHCTARVTSMERIHGRKITEQPADDTKIRRQLAGSIVKALVARPLFERSQSAIFHADPHAGNLFLTHDNRVAILDWSLVGHLGEPERVVVTQIILAALTLDVRRVVTELTKLDSPGNKDRAKLRTIAEKWIGRIHHGDIPGLTWLVGLLDDATQHARLRPATDLILFRKSLLTLEGVIAEVAGTPGSTDEVLLMEFVRHFIAEWPGRCFKWAHLPNHTTRLSNLDIARLLCGLPATAVQLWTDRAFDVFHQPEWNST